MKINQGHFVTPGSEQFPSRLQQTRSRTFRGVLRAHLQPFDFAPLAHPCGYHLAEILSA